MNRELLEKPFTPDQIKQREGNFGKTLDYIEGHAVIQRLNDAFNSDWSFSILKHEILKDTDEVIVLGELKAGGIIKTQFGSSRITRVRETGNMLSLADDLKAAGTDALKKCATLLGVGLHLYNRGTDVPQGQSGNGNGYRSGGNGNNGHTTGGNRYSANGSGQSGQGYNRTHEADGNGRLSSKQYQYLQRLNEEHGGSTADLDKQCVTMFGVVAQHLSKLNASRMIEHLRAN